VGKEGVILKNHAYIPLVRFIEAYIPAFQKNPAFIRALKPRYNPEQSGFTAAGSPQNCNEFAPVNSQVNSPQHIAISEAFFYPFQPEQFLFTQFLHNLFLFAFYLTGASIMVFP